MYREFYHEVGAILNNIERKDFLSYCQHHGLPTNLIDITESPLVALYFASSGLDESKGEKGYIYMYDKTKCIEVSDFVYNIDQREVSIIDIIYNDLNLIMGEEDRLQPLKKDVIPDIDRVSTYIDQMHLIAERNERFFMEMFLEMIRNYLVIYMEVYPGKIKNEEIEEEIIKLTNMEEEDNIEKLKSFLFEHFLNINCNDVNKTDIEKMYLSISDQSEKYIFPLYIEKVNLYDSSKNEVKTFVNEILIGFFLVAFKELYKMIKIFIKKDINLKFPIFIYNSRINFDRIKFQNGSFIFYTESNCDNGTKVKTSIKEDLIIEITDKKRILRELDGLGINEKTLFGDSDSIANYIKTKYGY